MRSRKLAAGITVAVGAVGVLGMLGVAFAGADTPSRIMAPVAAEPALVGLGKLVGPDSLSRVGAVESRSAGYRAGATAPLSTVHKIAASNATGALAVVSPGAARVALGLAPAVVAIPSTSGSPATERQAAGTAPRAPRAGAVLPPAAGVGSVAGATAIAAAVAAPSRLSARPVSRPAAIARAVTPKTLVAITAAVTMTPTPSSTTRVIEAPIAGPADTSGSAAIPAPTPPPAPTSPVATSSAAVTLATVVTASRATVLAGALQTQTVVTAAIQAQAAVDAGVEAALVARVTHKSLSPAYLSYRVRPGDTVESIARQFHDVAWLIRRRNALWTVVPGQQVSVWRWPFGQPYHIVATVQTDSPHSYAVRAGDTLGAIAAALGSDVVTLANDNGLGTGNIIVPGQVLILHHYTSHQGRVFVPGVAASQLSTGLLLTDVANFVHIDAALVKGLVWHETGWRMVRGASGEIGMVQIMPYMADWVQRTLVGYKIDPNVPVNNVMEGTLLLAYYLDTTGHDTHKALALYHSGNVRADDRNGAYLRSILALRDYYYHNPNLGN